MVSIRSNVESFEAMFLWGLRLMFQKFLREQEWRVTKVTCSAESFIHAYIYKRDAYSRLHKWCGEFVMAIYKDFNIYF